MRIVGANVICKENVRTVVDKCCVRLEGWAHLSFYGLWGEIKRIFNHVDFDNLCDYCHNSLVIYVKNCLEEHKFRDMTLR